MELLKTAATFISKGFNDFGFNFEEKIDLPFDSFWRLYHGTRKANGMSCSLFVFEETSFPGKWHLAHNALLKLRALHHPHIIRYLNSKEVEGSSITIVTERVTPLTWNIKKKTINEEILLWGLYQISVAINFIHENALSIHGNLRLSSIFVSESGEWKVFGLELLSPIKEDDSILYTYGGESGEWKVFGLELLSPIKEDDSILYTYGGSIPDSSKYMPPEIQKKSWKHLKIISPRTAIDTYNLGCLIYEIFNGTFKTSSDLIQKGKIPRKLFDVYKKLLAPNPALRLSISKFINYGNNDGGFFKTDLIECSEFLEHFLIKDKEQRNTFLKRIDNSIDKFPKSFLKFKVLTCLTKSFEFSEDRDKLFSLILKIGTFLVQDDYESIISPFIIRMFSNQNRSIRLCLLENLSNYVDNLSNKVINDKIFPQMLIGFNDIAPLIREETIKAIIIIISKLSEQNINNELLKYLIRAQHDEHSGIRTNTIICLGKIGNYLKPNNCRKFLIPAFKKSLQDPFTYARIAALMALNATCNLFDESDCCLKLIPIISPVLVDNEMTVRLQAKKTINLYLQRVMKLIFGIDNTSEVDNLNSLNICGSKNTQESNSTPVSKNKVNNEYKNCPNNIYKTQSGNRTDISLYDNKNMKTQPEANELDILNGITTDHKTYDLSTFGTSDKNKNSVNSIENCISLQLNKLASVQYETNNITVQSEQNIWDDDWNSSGDDDWGLD
ncbi:hypothetical protein PORY_001249 [Pneumocystis oryctolagi]|uniref:Uncharacterized protein n=1 Tax=Pneumocystis oryctolagi TaxID=42067 RepID=A0ACB7CBH5_9ASCO|nr:hypothetical protein PORY_001249 [Pneumocystis oryctolagi]